MSAIKNYGLFWERSYIDFGYHGVPGSLRGINRKNKSQAIDFREQIGIYVLYDKNLHPVYVGQAGSGEKGIFIRLRQHRKDHLRSRWESFSWFGMREVNESGQTGELSENQKPESRLSKYTHIDAMNELEGILIATLEPNLNRQGPKWKDAQEFLQEIDEELYTSRDHIYAKLTEIESSIQELKL